MSNTNASEDNVESPSTYGREVMSSMKRGKKEKAGRRRNKTWIEKL